MTRLAHLTDTHLLEPGHASRSPGELLRLRLLSFGRPLDAADRRARLRRWMARAAHAGADHLVLTGDLTEDGADAQFEVLAEVLADGPFPPEHVTLVPGNHDAYASEDGWARALAGPLRAYQATSAPGVVTRLGDDAVLVPLSTRFHQRVARAAGRMPPEDLATLDAVARDAVAHDGALATRLVVAAMHHPPLVHALPGARFVDGIENLEAVRARLAALPRLAVLHGHTHRATDRPLEKGERPRVFSTTACVEHDSPLRLYDVHDGALRPLPRTPSASARAQGPSGPTAYAPA